jgi:hypothetical protein
MCIKSPNSTAGRRRWFSIVLRPPLWAFVGVVIAVFLGVGLWVAVPNYREHVARHEIERVGGRIEIRLRNFGNPDSGDLVEVVLSDSRATDDTLACLQRLPPFESLLLENTAVSDDGLGRLQGLGGLQNLRLSGTRVTDAGLGRLAGLKSLQVLSLDHTQVSDAGLVWLRELTGLDLLLLSDTKATEKGIAALKQALPDTRVVVDRALAAPPDPVPPESDIIRFRFRHGPARRQTPEGHVELPETECGELLFERKTGRCVYRYWYDGIHEVPWGVRRGDVDAAVAQRLRSTLMGAAAFDGKGYWAASYSPDRLANEHHAQRITVYQDRDDLEKRDGVGAPWMALPRWYHWAPLHALAATIGSDALKRDEMHRAIRAFPWVKAHGPHAFELGQPTGFSWNYVVSIDQSELGIRRIEIRYNGNLMGHYPLPVPMSYSMERENAEDVDSKRLDELTDFSGYIDDKTVVVK